MSMLRAVVLATTVVMAASCRTSEAGPERPFIPTPVGGDELAARRVVLHDAMGRKRIVLDADTGIQMYGIDGKLAITLNQKENLVVIQCGQGAFKETPDGPRWDPLQQFSCGVMNGSGFVFVTGKDGYTHLTDQGVQSQSAR
jgi:hypothetical protein